MFVCVEKIEINKSCTVSLTLDIKTMIKKMTTTTLTIVLRPWHQSWIWLFFIIYFFLEDIQLKFDVKFLYIKIVWFFVVVANTNSNLLKLFAGYVCVCVCAFARVRVWSMYHININMCVAVFNVFCCNLKFIMLIKSTNRLKKNRKNQIQTS